VKKQADFFGTIKGGKIHFQHMGLFKQFLTTFPDDTSVKITVGQQYGSISDQQIKYYYGVIIPAGMKQYGYHNPDDMDRAFKATYLVDNKGTDFERIKSKQKDCDSFDLSWFIEQCITQLSQDGVTVEPADKLWKVKKEVKENESGS
jgi:hypothetical protein